MRACARLYDWFVEHLLVYGGEDAEGNLYNDIFLYKTTDFTWTRSIPVNESPPPRRDFVYCHSTYGNGLFIAGGHNGIQDLKDFWQYDIQKAEWNQLPDLPVPVTGGAVFPAYNRFYVFDGATENILMYYLDANTWESLETVGQGPVPRKYAAMASSSMRAWLFGGEGSVLGDVWKVFKYFENDTQRDTWEKRTDMPEPMLHSAAALLPGRVVLFGGQKSAGSLSADTYIYTTPKGYAQGMVLNLRTVTAAIGEEIRVHARGFDDAKGEIPLPDPVWTVDDGGVIHPAGQECTFTATHLNHFTVSCQDQIYGFEKSVGVAVSPARGNELKEIFPEVSPPGRSGHSMVAIGNAVYLFGGQTGGSLGKSNGKPDGLILNDFWRLEEAQNRWERQLHENPIPVARNKHSAWTYDGKLYIFGGRDADWVALDDFWEFNPSTGAWREIVPNGVKPSRRWNAATRATSDGDVYMVSGISDQNVAEETWHYSHLFNQWAEKSSFSYRDSLYSTSTAIFEDKLYVFGSGNYIYN